MVCRLFIGLLFLFLFAACKKERPVGETTVSVEQPYLITNHMGEAVNIVVYRSREDYAMGINAEFSARINTADTVTWIDRKMVRECFIDWYTDDYGATNWAVELPYPATGLELPKPDYYEYRVEGERMKKNGRLDIFGDGNGLGEKHFAKKYAREVFLNLDRAATTWIAFDKKDAGNNSIWGRLSPAEQYLEITFRKDMTYVSHFTDTGQSAITEEGSYAPDLSLEGAGDGYVQFKWSAAKTYGALTNYDPVYPGTHYTDTLCWFMPDFSYIMLKKLK